MRVKLDQLQEVVKKAIKEEKRAEHLREEVSRVLGPIMDTDVSIEELAEAVNDRIAVMERTGRDSRLVFKPEVVVRFTRHKNVEVRKMCAKLLPEGLASKMAFDPDWRVRAILAERLDIDTVKRMIRKYPGDKDLRLRLRQRLAERDEHLHIHDEKRVGDAAKQQDVPSLSDNWYRTQADLFMQDYGQDIYETTGQSLDYNWEEQVVRNFCRHSKATSGVEIDEVKLLKAVQELIKEREDAVLKTEATSDLGHLAQRLLEEHDREALDESPVMPILSEDVDPVRELVELRLSPSDYIDRVNEMFSVRHNRIPPGLRKYRMGEGMRDQQIPMKARLPHGGAFRAVDERALDLYVEAWNRRQSISGEPVRIAWNPDPGEQGVVGFEVIIR